MYSYDIMIEDVVSSSIFLKRFARFVVHMDQLHSFQFSGK